MRDPTPVEVDQVLRFVLDEIDSVPELEALLLVWQNRPAAWDFAEIATRLYIGPDQARSLLADLSRKGLISQLPDRAESYRYEPRSAEQDALLAARRRFIAEKSCASRL